MSVPDWLYRRLRDEHGWSVRPVAPEEHVRVLPDGRRTSRWPRRQLDYPVLEHGLFRVSVGVRGVGQDTVSHADLLSRAWGGSNPVASLADVVSWNQQQDRPGPADTWDWIKQQLLSSTRPPLDDALIAREIAEITEILAAQYTPEQLADPQVKRGIALAAEGMFVSRVVYGHPEVGRANRLHDDAFEKRELGVRAFFHNGMDMAAGLRNAMNAMGPDADIHEVVLAMIADAWSDSMYGGGRYRDNPGGYDELKSAQLLHDRALLYGFSSSQARIMAFVVNATGFDQGTGTQMIASADAVARLRVHWDLDDREFEVAQRIAVTVAGTDLQGLSEAHNVASSFLIGVEDIMSRRHSEHRILGRVLAKTGIQVNTIEDALRFVDMYGALRPDEYDGPLTQEEYRALAPDNRTLREALIDRLERNAGFVDPETGYRYPPGWRFGERGNVEMRRRGADELRRICARLRADPTYRFADAYADALAFAAEVEAHPAPHIGPAVVSPSAAWTPDSADLVRRLVGKRPPTLDELRSAFDAAARDSDLASLAVIGRSSEGTPMSMLSMNGRGGRTVPNIVIGIRPHANESVGDAAALALIGHLRAHPELLTATSYHFVVIDPDAAALAAPWPADPTGPVNLAEHHRGFYRQPLAEQPEWSFESPWFPLPNATSAALARMYDRTRPMLAFAQHNAQLGGVFTLFSGDDRWLPDMERYAHTLGRIADRHGLAVAESHGDTVGLEQVGPGAFREPRYGVTTSLHGGRFSSSDYASRFGGLGLQLEVGEWSTPDVDTAAVDVRGLVDRRIDTLARIVRRLPPAEMVWNPHARAAADQIHILRKVSAAIDDHGVADFHLRTVHTFALRAAGLMVQFLDQRRDARPHVPLLNIAARAMHDHLTDWSQEAAQHLRPAWVPLAQTAGYQLDGILAISLATLLRERG
ncbi:MAG: hypothetical protein HOQ24_06890 [Mycobacteriaceae bacterium]|nr:hypothetical protein [Mycobacteriaceae bacterium]